MEICLRYATAQLRSFWYILTFLAKKHMCQDYFDGFWSLGDIRYGCNSRLCVRKMRGQFPHLSPEIATRGYFCDLLTKKVSFSQIILHTIKKFQLHASVNTPFEVQYFRPYFTVRAILPLPYEKGKFILKIIFMNVSRNIISNIYYWQIYIFIAL